MPFGGYKDFADCVRKNSDKDNPKAYCATIKRKVEKESISYMMPFTLKESTENEAVIHGIAVKATTSRNNVTYKVEGLKNNNTLDGMNIGIGHTQNPADNVGKISETTWDENDQTRKYMAKIYNTARYPDAIEMVKRGLWQFVSLEAIPLDAKMEEKDGSKNLIVNDLIFTGLDFVKSPGIQQASAALAGESLGLALYEALQMEERDMTQVEEKVEEQPKEKIEEIKEKVVYKTDPKLQELLEKQSKLLEILTEKVKKIEEQAEEEEKEVEEKSKAVVQEKTEEKDSNIIFESSDYGAGYKDFWVMPDGRMPALAE